MKISLMMQSFENGGVQRVMINLANGFTSKGFEVELLVADARGEMRKNISNKCKIINLDNKKNTGDFKFLFSIKKIKDYIEKSKPNVILACPGFANVVLIIANRLSKYKTKTIAILDNKLSLLKNSDIKHRISYIFYKIYLKKSDKIVAAHDSALVDIINVLKIDSNKICRIYHPLISNDLFEEHAFSHKWLNGKYLVLLSVGRLVKEKNFIGLIDSFFNLKRNYNSFKNSKLIIVGEGIERAALENRIAEYNLKNDVELYGFSSIPFEFMKRATLYVSSSSKEAFGNVIVEALACGLPVVATDCESGGPKEILSNGQYGVLCKLNDTNSLTEAIVKCYNKNVDKYKCKKRGLEFSVENSVNEYVKIIKEVCR